MPCIDPSVYLFIRTPLSVIPCKILCVVCCTSPVPHQHIFDISQRTGVHFIDTAKEHVYVVECTHCIVTIPSCQIMHPRISFCDYVMYCIRSALPGDQRKRDRQNLTSIEPADFDCFIVILVICTTCRMREMERMYVSERLREWILHGNTHDVVIYTSLTTKITSN